MVLTGTWSRKSMAEARRYADVAVAATNEHEGGTRVPAPAELDLRDDLSYVHLCSNETIDGLEWHELPDLRGAGPAVASLPGT